MRGLRYREVRWLLAAMVVGLAVRVAYVLITRHGALAGDQVEYDSEGRFIAAGKWFWTTSPFGHAHEGAWKAPGYPAWVGVIYSIGGAHVTAVRLAQTLFGPLNIALGWLLGRRLFDWRVGLAAAWVIALYPNAWQWEAHLYSESMAVPLSTAAIILFLDREVTPKRAALVGLLLGVNLLVRPSALLIVPGLAVAWWLSGGLRRGTLMLGLTLLAAVLVVAPWTYRNSKVLHGFVPVSLQADASPYGTFNSDAAGDPQRPYAWRSLPRPYQSFLIEGRHLSDIELAHRLRRFATDYIKDHPDSLAKAFFWNGLSRTWDIRRPARVLFEVPPEGRTRGPAIAGLAMYWVLLPLAIAGLWRARRRPRLVLPVLAIALSASIVFTADAASRYRAPLEPLIVVLACSAAVPFVSRGLRAAPWSRRRSAAGAAPGPPAALPPRESPEVPLPG